MKTKPLNIRYPWSDVNISYKDRKEVQKALVSNWVSNGNYLNLLSSEIKAFLRSENSEFLPTSSGTSAIGTIYKALKLIYGRIEVVIPAYGFMAAANLAIQNDFKVIFADVNPRTWCIDKKSVKKVITKNTRLLVAIHNYGNLCDIQSIKEVIPDNCLILEDCAEALGSKFMNKYAGTFGNFSTFSFHATKLITTGEGGGILINDLNYVDLCKLIISHGLRRKIDYYHEVPGNNFRMSNINAALGYSQFKSIDSKIQRIRNAFSEYKEILKKNKLIQLQEISDKVDFVPWSLPIILQNDSALKVKSRMLEKGIETRTGFVSPRFLPFFSSIEKKKNSDYLSKQILNLPLYPSLRAQQIKFIGLCLNEITNAR